MPKANETQKAKAVPTIAADVNEAGALILTFSNGRIIQVHPAELDKTIVAQATLHGLKQKLVDAAAIARNPDTGLSATVQDKFEAVSEVYQRLIAGQWNKPAEGGGNAGGILLTALVKVTGKDREVLKTWLEGKTTEQKAALRKDAKVAAAIAEIEAERLKSNTIDSGALLGELDNLGA